MPQLNPSPWFFILLEMWLIMLLLMQPSLMNFFHLNMPTKSPTKTRTTPWYWTWH